MPLKSGKLTAREAIFVGHMAATGDPTYAAKMANYSQPEMRGREMAKSEALAPVIRQAIDEEARKGALGAIRYLNRVVADEKEGTRQRIAAAQTVLKAFYTKADGSEDKEPHEMSPAEMQAKIEALRRTLADIARPVIEHEQGDVFG